MSLGNIKLDIGNFKTNNRRESSSLKKIKKLKSASGPIARSLPSLVSIFTVAQTLPSNAYKLLPHKLTPKYKINYSLHYTSPSYFITTLFLSCPFPLLHSSTIHLRSCAHHPLATTPHTSNYTYTTTTMEELGIQTPVVPALALPKAKDWPVQEEQLDIYLKLKKLQKELDLLMLQEDYIKDEQRHLKRELVRAQEEVKRIRSVPLVIGQFLEPIDENTGIVSSTTGSNYVVRILSTLDRELLKPSSSVALHRHSNALVDILPPEADSLIAIVGDNQKPDVTYADVGGLDMQKQEIREAVELPLTQGDLYSQIGIDPPRGVLLYGPPGTGKTMLVKAVANSTTASFIRINGSEFVQKYLGEGPRMVRDVFRLARENSPSIIFIDEIDAIATKRFDAQTGADREVQRILLELLNQMDGFDQTSNVKVIMATNRADTLDPALLRPGRLDRKIEFPSLKDRRERRLIFSTVASKMALAPEVDLDSLIVRNDPLSGAVIAAIMQEAGLRAVRKNRYMILQSDLDEAYAAQVKTGTEHDKFDFYK